ncbi:helix-turn-helix domain-containing protein [Frigidibacter sp. SD6-1]|nr:helix-turn-helix domain-containing protein [Frigidibacter sp. SD6-1]
MKCRGNRERAATLLGLPRRTLNDKIKRFGLTP